MLVLQLVVPGLNAIVGAWREPGARLRCAPMHYTSGAYSGCDSRTCRQLIQLYVAMGRVSAYPREMAKLGQIMSD